MKMKKIVRKDSDSLSELETVLKLQMVDLELTFDMLQKISKAAIEIRNRAENQADKTKARSIGRKSEKAAYVLAKLIKT